MMCFCFGIIGGECFTLVGAVGGGGLLDILILQGV